MFGDTLEKIPQRGALLKISFSASLLVGLIRVDSLFYAS